MENRSFDHMLGYLQNDGMPEVRGLVGDESNPDAGNSEHRGYAYPPEPFPDSFDPCHAPGCVDEAARGRERRLRPQLREVDGDTEVTPPARPRLRHGPLHARSTCRCTTSSRGTSASATPGTARSPATRCRTGSTRSPGGRPRRARRRAGRSRCSWLPGSVKAEFAKAPIYDIPAFTRQLKDDDWRWYSHDPATLRAVDGRYRSFPNLDRDNFAWFDKKEISLATRDRRAADRPGRQLPRRRRQRQAAQGVVDRPELREPAGVRHLLERRPPAVATCTPGSSSCSTVYDSLARSPQLGRHVARHHLRRARRVLRPRRPPLPADDGSKYPTLGVRVPALVVGPRVPSRSATTQFDHTSLIATILRRFAANPDQAVTKMGKRDTAGGGSRGLPPRIRPARHPQPQLPARGARRPATRGAGAPPPGHGRTVAGDRRSRPRDGPARLPDRLPQVRDDDAARRAPARHAVERRGGGAGGGARTRDIRFTRAVLCQLSYPGIPLSGGFGDCPHSGDSPRFNASILPPARGSARARAAPAGARAPCA